MIFPTPAAAFSSYHCVNPQIRMQARKEKILSPSQHSASSFCCLVCIAGNIPVSLCFVLLSPFLAFLSLTTSQSLRLRLMTLDSSVLPPSLTYYCSHFPFAPLLPYSITNSPTHPGPSHQLTLPFLSCASSSPSTLILVHSPLQQLDEDNGATAGGWSPPAARARLGGLGESRRRRKSPVLRMRGDASAVDLRAHSHAGLRQWGSSPEVTAAQLVQLTKSVDLCFQDIRR